jgi:hypothetical protein
MAVSGTADSQEIQSLNDNLIKVMISVAENLFPSEVRGMSRGYRL